MNAIGYKKQLLLVEDSQDEALIIQTIIKKENINIKINHISDGSSAYEFLSNSLLDGTYKKTIVLLDLNLPKMTGKEILEKFGKNISKFKLLVLSGSENPIDIRDCLQFGVSYYLKPWNYTGYIDFIRGPFMDKLKEVRL